MGWSRCKLHHATAREDDVGYLIKRWAYYFTLIGAWFLTTHYNFHKERENLDDELIGDQSKRCSLHHISQLRIAKCTLFFPFSSLPLSLVFC